MSFEFILMMKYSEPYPAVILPSFKTISSLDTLRSSQFKLNAFGERKVTSLEYKNIYKAASANTIFYMILRLPDETPSRHISEPECSGKILKHLKDRFLYNRLRVLNNSNADYSNMKTHMHLRIEEMLGRKVDSLVLIKKEIKYNLKNNKGDTVFTNLKTIIF